jgi:NodT family efflux transporter outer membrane factor (OMF) lipoprotein
MSYPNRKHLAFTGLALILAGCAVGPDYTPPDAPVPKAWVTALPEQETSAPAASSASMATLTKKSQPASAAAPMANPEPVVLPSTAPDQSTTEQAWWKQFHDPLLNKLIEQALTSNFDIKIAEARIEQARANRSSSQSDLLPTVNIAGSGTREANQLAFPQETSAFKQPYNIFQTGFDASWELDLFGGKRRELESSTAELEATQADRDNALVSLLAEIARTYVDIRLYQAQIDVANQIIITERNSVAITQQLFNAGSSPGLDVTQAQAQAQQTEAQLPLYESQLKQSILSLDVLLGNQPGTSFALFTSTAPFPASNDRLVLDAPSTVITNRPDIRAAERRLQEATAQQGVALAKFFPDISLSGFIGLLNTDAGSLLHGASKSWMIGGSVMWPILNYGQLTANQDYADAKQKEALADYQKTVISALADVERAVTAYNKQKEYVVALAAIEQADERASTIAQERYHVGLTSFVDVLVAQQTFFNARNQLVQAQAQVLADYVAIYKSLGRGWNIQLPKQPV